MSTSTCPSCFVANSLRPHCDRDEYPNSRCDVLVCGVCGLLATKTGRVAEDHGAGVSRMGRLPDKRTSLKHTFVDRGTYENPVGGSK